MNTQHTNGRTRSTRLKAQLNTRLKAQLNTRLKAQLNTRLEAHKCGLGTLTREALGTIGSGPNMLYSDLNRSLYASGTADEILTQTIVYRVFLKCFG